jgi:arginyl-tRNA synthetase
MLQKIIVERCTEAFQKAFPDYDVKTNPVEVTQSTHERFGHYQCNSAMKLSKIFRQSPKAIADKVLTCLKNPPGIPVIQQAEVAGAGFINIHINSLFISDYAEHMRRQGDCVEKSSPPHKMVIEFSSPNTAKEMHVGHLRSTIIGDALARLFEAKGDEVLRLNHIGDWGTAFGMLIAYLKQHEPEVLTGQKTAELGLLVSSYKKSKALFDADAEFKKASQLEVVALQGGDTASLKAWRIICDISRKAYQEIYDLLGIRITERGESYYNPLLKQVVDEVTEKGLIVDSGGAKCLFLEGFVNREGEPLPFMLQKSDGGFNYSTTDLASIQHRIQVEKAK